MTPKCFFLITQPLTMLSSYYDWIGYNQKAWSHNGAIT